MRKRYSPQTYTHHIEMISKLRHCHLVSSLGHCFECYQDDSSMSRIFLIFEFVPNGTLRGYISGTFSIHCILLPFIWQIIMLGRTAMFISCYIDLIQTCSNPSQSSSKLCIPLLSLPLVTYYNTWFGRTSQTKIYLDTKNSSCNWGCEGYSISAHRDCSRGIFK